MSLQPKRSPSEPYPPLPDRPGNPREESLAERLSSAPLPLPLALSYATDIAAALRALHYDGHPHGWVNAAAVVLTPEGAVLKGGHASRQASLRSDIAAFGALLYEMIHAKKTGPDLPLPVVPCTVPRTGREGLKLAASRLASRCLSDDSLDMQKVATEVRLLKVLSRQLSISESGTPDPPQPAGPPGATVAPGLAPAAGTRDALPDRAGDPPLDDARCPRCGCPHVYISKPRTGVESFLGMIGSPVQRCHRCLHRYLTILGIHFTKVGPE